MVPIGIGRGSSSRDRRRRLLTHRHGALYRLTPFHTYLALRPASSHFAPSLLSPAYSPSRVSLTHVLLLLLSLSITDLAPGRK